MATTYIALPTSGQSAYWGDPVANVAALPATGTTGEIRYVIDVQDLYEWTGSAWVQITANTADVTGPGSSTDNAIARFDGTGGKTIQNSAVTIADTSGNMAGVGTLSSAEITSSSLTASRALVSGTSKEIQSSSVTSTELGYVSGVSSAIQTQINTKQATITGGATTITSSDLTASRALVSDVSGKVAAAAATTLTEIGYVNGVTSAIQTQFTGKEPTITAGVYTQYWRGDKVFQTLNAAALVANVSGAAQSASAIGEILSATQAGSTATGVGSTGTWGNVTSVTLSAGSWLVWGIVGFKENGAVLTDFLACGISASSSGSGMSEFDTSVFPGMISSGSDLIMRTPSVPINVSGTTDYYLNTKFTYSSGSPQHRGKIVALRIF